MNLLTQLFVGNPQNILVISGLFFVGYFGQKLTKTTAIKRPRLLLVTAIIWMLYAGWEELIRVNSPETNIRVDLLILWPLLIILSVWALLRTFR
ncbi:MAG: hypothetical protein KAG93_02100 [Desulfuromusa sp.]|nr:hypothetical protein [Desulfuromusa sp.]